MIFGHPWAHTRAPRPCRARDGPTKLIPVSCTGVSPPAVTGGDAGPSAAIASGGFAFSGHALPRLHQAELAGERHQVDVRLRDAVGAQVDDVERAEVDAGGRAGTLERAPVLREAALRALEQGAVGELDGGRMIA